MKIVDVCEFYSPQGSGVKVYIKAKFAAAAVAGHEVVVVAPSDRNEVVPQPGGRLILVKAPALPFDKRYNMFWDEADVHAVLDREQGDIVEASSPWMGAKIVARWQGNAAKALFMHHDPLSAWAYRWFEGIADRDQIDRGFGWFWRYLRWLGERIPTVVCAAPSLTARLAAGGIGGTVTVPMGVDAGVFSPDLRDEALRAELLARCGLPADATLLLGIGRHTNEKRWPTVIDAVTSVAARRPVGLVLIGSGHKQKKVLAHIADNPHVQPLAPIMDRARLATVMASGDALIHGSAAETFGLVASEALASGLPLILPDQGAVADIARPEFAELYRTGDPRDAAAAIERMLDRDQLQLRAATRAAAARARTLDDHFVDLFATYQGVLDRKRAA